MPHATAQLPDPRPTAPNGCRPRAIRALAAIGPLCLALGLTALLPMQTQAQSARPSGRAASAPAQPAAPAGPAAASGVFKHLKPDPAWTTEQRRCMSLLDLAVDVHAAHMWVKDKDLKETARQNFGAAKQLDLAAEFLRPPEYFEQIVKTHEASELRDAEAAERAANELREARRTAARATRANQDMARQLVELSEGNAALSAYSLQTVRSEMLYARCMYDYTRLRAPLRAASAPASGAAASAPVAAAPAARGASGPARAASGAASAAGTNAEIDAACANATLLMREACIRQQCAEPRFANASMCERRLRGQGGASSP